MDRKELILEGLAYTVMGILVVFMILVIIMMVIKAMALLSGESKPKEKKEKQQVKKEQSSLVPDVVPVATQKTDDSELIAVITAAIAAAMGQSASGFVVRSYKAVSGNAWNKAGRMDVLENRL